MSNWCLRDPWEESKGLKKKKKGKKNKNSSCFQSLLSYPLHLIREVMRNWVLSFPFKWVLPKIKFQTLREPSLSLTRLGSVSLSCSKLRNKAYLFPNQNKSFNVQFDINTKEVKGLFGFAEGKEGTSSSCKCQLQMINESTQTNRKGSKSTQGQLVQMSKGQGRASRQFVEILMKDFPREDHKVLWLQIRAMVTLPQAYREELSAGPLETQKCLSSRVRWC